MTSPKSIDDAIASIYQLRTKADAEPLQRICQLLLPWTDPPDPSSLRPDALERLNNTFVMGVAIDKNWDAVLHLLLSLGMQIRETDMPTAIQRAKERRSFEALRSLFAAGWDIDRPLNDYCPPAMSLLLEHRNFVEACLALGASPHTSSPSGHTTMQRAVAYAPLSVIQLLDDHGAVVANTNLLPHAALSYIDTAGEPGLPDRLEVIRYLIERGASINAFYGDTLKSDVPSADHVFYGRMTALHFAIAGGKMELVGLLLQSGANAGLETWSGWKTEGRLVSSVELARRCGFEDIASVLSDREEGKTQNSRVGSDAVVERS